MPTKTGVAIVGLAEFRSALRAAQGRAPREFAMALKKGGEPILRRAAAGAPSQFGPSLTTSVRGASAAITSRLPWGGGAEWGRFGKWAGFVRRWGEPPRFVWPAAEAEAQAVAEIIANELRDIMTAFGWFRGM